jgi:hypothetical protein
MGHKWAGRLAPVVYCRHVRPEKPLIHRALRCGWHANSGGIHLTLGGSFPRLLIEKALIHHRAAIRQASYSLYSLSQNPGKVLRAESAALSPCRIAPLTAFPARPPIRHAWGCQAVIAKFGVHSKKRMGHA